MKIGLIGGSGLGAAMAEQTDGKRHAVETPFGPPSDAIVETEWNGLPILFLSRHGPGHLLNPSAINYRANIFALKKLGCTHILAGGAVGSLREEIRPRDLVIVDNSIDKTFRRAGTFFDDAAVHVEMAEPYCPVLRQILIESAAADPDRPAPVHKTHPRGTYVCMEGPSFSTRAESLMHRLWGGDVIGMTAMPEAKLAKEAEIPYAMIALVTDYDCWKTHAADAAGKAMDATKLMSEIIEHLKDATANAIALLRPAVAKIAENPSRLDACPSTNALKLAIWSDKSQISPAQRQRLGPLWMRYFEGKSE